MIRYLETLYFNWISWFTCLDWTFISNYKIKAVNRNRVLWKMGKKMIQGFPIQSAHSSGEVSSCMILGAMLFTSVKVLIGLPIFLFFFSWICLFNYFISFYFWEGVFQCFQHHIYRSIFDHVVCPTFCEVILS